ncbi:MAG: hypothetical protein AB7O52_05135 [Planctomycetota bacterium]
MDPAVDLVVNCFERTYRDVLRPGFFSDLASQHEFPFAQRHALLNNIDDLPEAVDHAQALVDRGEIDQFFLVAEHLPRALMHTRLTPASLGRVPHYSDCALVAVTIASDSPWIVYWDAEARLLTPFDWIRPSVSLMERDPRVLVANPSWEPDTVDRETWEEQPPFALGYGFSDQVFLARRADFAAPIYDERCLPALRYPLSHIAQVFEARVDGYMRRHRRLRATHRLAHYAHEVRSTGGPASIPSVSLAERLRKWRNRKVTRLLRRSPLQHPCWRI